MTDKQQLRQHALGARRGLDRARRASASMAVQQRCLQYVAGLGHVDDVLLYRALPDEVDTTLLFARLPANTYAPVTRKGGSMQWLSVGPQTEWRKGAHGVHEPLDGRPWIPGHGRSLLVCPMAGFDRQGNRLGLGLGCFDRWLAGSARHLHRIIGLAFACQEVPGIPCDAHDIPMHVIITETETLKCRTR